MADTVNLNTFRKARAKAADKSQAEANRVLHGLPKAERQRAKAERERAARLLDQSRRKD
jgi:hypothetical protein